MTFYFSARRFAAFSLSLLAGSVASAGPPLAIDDPGVLDPGTWEIITAVAMEKTDSGKSYEIPVLDVSFGLTANTQVSAAAPIIHADPDGASSETGLGNAEIVFKWRVINRDDLQVSFAPAYAFGVGRSDANKGLGDKDAVAFIPINAEYALGHWSLNGEVGYVAATSGDDSWSYGAAMGHPVGAKTQAFIELYGGVNHKYRDNTLNFHVGADVEITEQWHVLVSVGSGLREPMGADQLDLDAFIGLQYFP